MTQLDKLREAVKNCGPVKITLGDTGVFESEEHDVVIIHVLSTDLHNLRRKVENAVENTQTFPDYKPHITIAYVKKGKGKEYAEKLNTLKGKEITLDTLTFSDTDRNHVYFPLNKEAHQFDEDIHGLMKQGYHRVFRIGDEVYSHNEHIPLNHKQKNALVDEAIKHKQARVIHDSGEDERTVWDKNNQFAEIVHDGIYKFPIHKNISHSTAEQIRSNAPSQELRGLRDHEGNHYVWDAAKGVHDTVANHLGLGKDWLKDNSQHLHAKDEAGLKKKWKQFAVKDISQHEEEQFAEDEDSVEVDAYHASHKQIHGLEENHTAAKGKGAFGPGIYFSPHADVAKAWANKSPNGVVHLHKAKLKFNHPLDLTKPLSKKSTEKLSKHLGREIHPESSVAFSLERRHGSVTEGAKAAGFDGVIHWIDRKHGPEKNYIVTHPHHIVSLEHSEHSSQHEEQFAENDLLTEFLSQSLANQIQSTQQEIISLKWKATEMRLPELAQVVQQELRKLDQHLHQGLIHVGYQGAIEGTAEVVEAYENLPTEQKVQKPTSNSVTPTPSIEGDTPTPPKPPKSPLEALGEPIPPEVRLPDLERAIMTLMRPTAMVGTDWKETAELVKAGAFAITGDIAQHQSTEVQLALAEAMSEGHSASEFIETVQEKIFEGRGPLSDSHLENIFRTNTLRQKSNAKERTLKSDLVSDAFPYRAYNATADARTRPHHKALEHLGIDNTNIYNADDPVFIRYRPSWWYSCRCNHYGVTVVQAANRGVKEAVEWVDRAKQTAEIEKGSFYQYLNTTKPLFFQMVPPVPFDDPSFNDATPATSQHSENNYSHRHFIDSKGQHNIHTYDSSGNKVASAQFVDKEDHLKVAPGSTVYVEPQHRRKGIATSIYNHIQSLTGKKVKKSTILTPDGSAFENHYFNK